MAHWRVATVMTHTVDEYGVLFRNLFAIGNVEAAEVRGIIVSSVVYFLLWIPLCANPCLYAHN